MYIIVWLPNAQLCKSVQSLHIESLLIAELSQARQTLHVSRSLRTYSIPLTQDLYKHISIAFIWIILHLSPPKTPGNIDLFNVL